MLLSLHDPNPVRKTRLSIATAFTIFALIWITKISFLNLVADNPSEEAPPEGPPEGPPERPSQFNPMIKKNVAAIVEGRSIENLAPLILHYASVLGPEWPIFIFTHENPVLPDSTAFKRALDTQRVNIRALPADIEFTNRDSVSGFFTQPWFWEQLAPARHVLLFQSDSIICANSPLAVEDFLEYDFIGAPVNPNLGFGDEGMNGGLSLRNRSMFLDIIRQHSWKDELANATNPLDPRVKYEDQWYYHKLRAMRDRTDGGQKAILPFMHEAGQFSVESLWFDRPFGFHQSGRWNHDRQYEIDRYCPERRMATSVILAN